MMFGVLIIPMLAGAGIGIDMMRASEMRSELAEAADSGLLAAVRAKQLQKSLTDAKAQEIARRYFDANGSDSSDVVITDFAFTEDTLLEVYRLSISGSIKTTLMGAVGRDTVPINIVSEAQITPPRDLEVALVLDNTYSMVGKKLDDLKDAADDLVESLMLSGSENVKIGLVPFSQYVNVGLGNRDEAWIDVPDDYTTVKKNVCSKTYPNKKKSNCKTITTTCSKTRDGVTTTWTCKKTKCDVDKGDPVVACKDKTKKFKWQGCVGSRDEPYNVEDALYSTFPVPGLLNISCAQEIAPLTSSKSAIKSKIQAMAVQGDQTYIPGGLTWGYRVLSNAAPYSEGVTYAEMNDQNSVKALVLMTDGVNTRSANFPYHNKKSGSDANDTLEELCDEIKGSGIRVFSIAFEISDSKVRDLIEGCASAPGDYFNATDGVALAQAFEAIGLSLTELALVK